MMKSSVEEERHKNREKNKKKFEKYKQAGNQKKAVKKFSESLDITPAMAHSLIQVLKKLNVEFYVAPYEADAELAYLWRIGYV